MTTKHDLFTRIAREHPLIELHLGRQHRLVAQQNLEELQLRDIVAEARAGPGRAR